MEYATSKQLWKLQSLAAERAELIVLMPDQGEVLTEIHLPLTKSGAVNIIATMIKTNESIRALLELRKINAENIDA